MENMTRENLFFDKFFQYDFIVIAKAHMVTHDENQVYDIVMNIMLHAYDKYVSGKYPKDECFPAWLSRVSYCYVVSNHARDKVYLGPLHEAVGCISRDEDFMEFENKLLCLEDLIEKLEPYQKRLIKLHLEGKIIQEIAVIMERKRSTIGAQLKKLKRDLKEQMIAAGFTNSYKNDFF